MRMHASSSSERNSENLLNWVSSSVDTCVNYSQVTV